MSKIIIPIKGMHCRSCEILVAEKLKELPSVRKVSVSLKDREAMIYSQMPLKEAEVIEAVRQAGYDVGSDEKPLISKNPADWRDLLLAAGLLLVLYLILKKFGLFNFGFGRADKPSSLVVVLLVGLTAGFSTCMALVGGLVLGVAARHSEKHPEANAVQNFRPHLFFNLGRILSYFVLGGLIGLLGSAFQLSGEFLGLLTITVGLVMLVLGLELIEIFPWLSSGIFTLPPAISRFLGLKNHHQKEYSHKNAAILGALTFFLPCGFTQAMQIYAMSTGSFLNGSAIMAIFALGTAPGLLGVGGLTSIVKGALAKKFFKFAGLIVTVLAVINLTNGWNLMGWKFPLPTFNNSAGKISNNPGSAKADPNVTESNGVQIVKMTQDTYGYSPNKFTIKKNRPVRWIINSTDSETCAIALISSKIGVRKILKLGENIIEFTPKESGEIRFSCSMGMYRGLFQVID